jgi:hypothetical protein
VRLLPPTAGQSGRRLGWRRTMKDIPTLAAADAERAPALTAFLRNTPEAILRADDDGIPEAVENLDEITAQAKRVTADLAMLAPLAASAPTLVAVVQEMVSPAVVRSALLSEGNSLLGFAGVEFTPGKTLEVAQELPNPLGGPSFPAVTRVRLLEHNVKARLLRIEARTTLDAAKARVALAQTLERMGQRLGKPLPPDAITRVDIETVHAIDIDLKDGWPARARTQRQIEIAASDGVARRVDTSLFVRRR